MVLAVAEYKSGQDLMENNATDGNWKGQFRDKFEERSSEIEKIKAGMNAEVALNNAMQAQQAQATQYIIDPVSGKVIETSESFSSGLSVAAFMGLIERGASEAEINEAMENAIASIAGKIAKDKKNAKKYLAHLLELVHVLELSQKQAGKNPELQNTLKQMQEKISNLMKKPDVAKIQEFLRSSALKQALQNAVQQVRQNPQILESMRVVREMVRNLAQQVKEANLPRELALKNLQQVSRDILQSQLRDMVNQLRDAYTKLSKEFQQETNPEAKEALKTALKTISEQARNLQDIARQNQKPELTTKQFEQIQKDLQTMQKQTQQLAATAKLSPAQQEIMSRLAQTQQQSLRATDARMAAQRVAQGNLNIATQASRQDALVNLRAAENLLVRNGTYKQQIPRDSAQLQLRDAHTRLSQELKVATDSSTRDALQNSLRTINAQARAMQELTKQLQNPALSAKQFELAQRSLQQLQAQTTQLAANSKLGQVGQQVAERLAVQQAASLRSLDSRLVSQRMGETNLNIANQAGRDSARIQETIKLGNNFSAAKVTELGKSLQLSQNEQKALSSLGKADIDSKKIDQLIEKGDFKGAKLEVQNAIRAQEARQVEQVQQAMRRGQEPVVKDPTQLNPRTTQIDPKALDPKVVDPKVREPKAETKPEPKPEIKGKPTGDVKSCHGGCPCGGCGSIGDIKEVAQQTGAASIGAQSVANAGGNLQAALKLTSVPPSTPVPNPVVTGAAQPSVDSSLEI